MGCKGCPGSNKRPDIDRNGNTINTESDMEKYEKETYNNNNQGNIGDLTYAEYLNKKQQYRSELKEKGKEIVASLPEDIKRIRIHELVSTYNHDEVTEVSPTQALVALWELMQMPPYKHIVDEFDGLEAQITEKYEALMKNKITLKWKNTLH